MHGREHGVLVVAFTALVLGMLGCSVGSFFDRAARATLTPTRTPRPTWTPAAGVLQVASPTLDATRYPGVVLPTSEAATPQVLVEGSQGVILVPQAPGGASGVQTVVVIIVTATPPPSPTATPLPPSGTPPPSPTPGPPTATPTVTQTPPPPAIVKVTTDKAAVRQGPGARYPLIARLDAGTEITVVGRNGAGDWWKVCCVNGSDVWISNAVVQVSGPLWLVQEVANIPAPPPLPPTAAPSATPAPAPTYAWPFRLEGLVGEYPLGPDYFSVNAVIYNGSTPLWGHKLKVRKLSTGQEWLSDGSQASWTWIVVEYPTDGKTVNNNVDCPNPRTGLRCVKSNVKWDSNSVQVTMGDGVWEVTATDGAGVPLSAPVRITTSATNSKSYYVVFTSRP